MDGMAVLNIDSLKTISCTIKKLTHSGCKKIYISQLKEIFDICRINGGYVEHSFSRIMIMLKENHSEVRLGSVLLCDSFFNSFYKFRSLLMDNCDTYLKFALGEKFGQHLPPPKAAASLVIKLTIKNFNSWFLKFGKNNPKLLAKYNYLRTEKFVDFETLEIYNPVERAEKEKTLSESLKINKALLLQACDEMKDIEDEINNSLASLETCFNLLIDFPNQIEKNESTDSMFHSDEQGLRLHGILKPNQNIEINLNSDSFLTVKVNDENSAIIENAKDMFSLINKKFLPKTKAWSVLISKADGGDTLSRQALQLLNKLENAVYKFNKLKFIDSFHDDEDCVSTDSELEDVEEKVVAKDKIKVEKEKDLFNELESRTKLHCGKNVMESFSDRKQKLLKIAPKLPYSTDLYHWENSAETTETLLPTASDGHRFWASSSLDSIEVPAESSRLRVIEFTGEFEPVTRACKAPLPSGKLCPRHDRNKCPLHGLIVPRDEEGNIINPEDKNKVKQFKPKEIVPDWQDPKLLAEIKAATGLDLKIGKKKRKKYPGLTDIKKKESSIDKLSKKIFKSSTMKKVNRTLDNLDYKRHRDKFGDQFNYVHGS